eukprot:4700706-Amphidinium_carterae.1
MQVFPKSLEKMHLYKADCDAQPTMLQIPSQQAKNCTPSFSSTSYGQQKKTRTKGTIIKITDSEIPKKVQQETSYGRAELSMSAVGMHQRHKQNSPINTTTSLWHH